MSPTCLQGKESSGNTVAKLAAMESAVPEQYRPIFRSVVGKLTQVRHLARQATHAAQCGLQVGVACPVFTSVMVNRRRWAIMRTTTCHVADGLFARGVQQSLLCTFAFAGRGKDAREEEAGQPAGQCRHVQAFPICQVHAILCWQHFQPMGSLQGSYS